MDTNVLNQYLSRIEPKVLNIINKKRSIYKYEKTIFGDNSKETIKKLKIAHEIRQKQMKEGIIAQIVFGEWLGWENLKIGHSSGLDIRKKDNTVVIELKNKYNTCNYDNQKAILDKLTKYKLHNPDTICVWGIINPKKNEKKLTQTITYNGIQIQKIQGLALFKYVFTYKNYDYSDIIIKYIRDIIHNNKVL